MKAHKFAILMLALAFILGTVPNQAAARSITPQQSASMTVTAGNEGIFKYGEWLLLWADIENPGADVDAELTVRVANNTGGVTYAVPVPLPSGARKRVPLYVLPNNFSRFLDVRLTSGETLLASINVPVRAQPNITYVIGLVTERRGALSLLNGIALPGQERPRQTADVFLDELPERPEGLGSIDLLVFNNIDTSQMTPEQGLALLRWVEQGGRLVIGGGSGAERTLAGLPDDLKPVDLTGSAEMQMADLGALAGFAGGSELPGTGVTVVSRFDAPESTALVGNADLPLVVERSIARGSVDFVALDLAAAPFEGWPQTVAFWEKLVEAGSAYPDTMPADVSVRQMRSSSFYYALSNIPSLDLPSVRGLSLLLIVYIILVGPVNYLLLRRFRKLHRAWVTIPVITVLFAAGAFGIGYALRGTDLILNKVAIVEPHEDGPASLQTYIGLFSPRRQSYVIEVEGGGLLSSAQQDYYSGMSSGVGGLAGEEVRFTQGDPALVEGLSVTQWSMQAFVSEDTWQNFGQLKGEMRLENGVLKGTVRNETGYALKDVVVVLNRRYQQLGDMAAGAEASVDIGLEQMSSDWAGSSIGYRIYMEPYQMQGNATPRDAMQKQTIIDNVIDNTSFSKTGLSANAPASAAGLRNVTIFGWTDQAPPDVSVRGFRITQLATTFVYGSTPIQIGGGNQSVPPGLIQGRLIEVDRGFGSCGMGASASVWLDNASATFEFIVPAELRRAGVRQVKLSLWRDNSMAKLEDLAVFDWQEQGWASIPDNGANLFSIQNGASYVSENGAVRVKVSVPSGNGTCLYLDLGVETGAGQGG